MKKKAESKVDRNKRRDPANTTMTISLPKDLKEAIIKRAEAENRPVSNYLVTELMKFLANNDQMLVLAALSVL